VVSGSSKALVDGNFAELLAFTAKLRSTGRLCRMQKPKALVAPRRGHAQALGFLALGLFTLGCGNTLYAMQVSAASSKLEEARELGAEQYAPYEYWYAVQHIDKAQTEASEADYSDAVKLAAIGEEYADKAIQLARDAHRGAGR